MDAAVLSIGTELTRGELVNGNAAWLAEQLTALGLEVVEHVTVDDNRDRIVAAIERLAERTRVVVVTGGLGPTSDDRTAEAAAHAAGVGLVRDDDALERMRRRWEVRGRPMPPSNAKQADFPQGATVIPNPVGTAPGFWLQLRDESTFFFLPGVPNEMRHLFSESVVPVIAPYGQRTSHQIHIRTFGMTESQVGEAVRDLEGLEDGVTLGFRASFPEIEVKVLARAESEPAAEHKARRIAEHVYERLGDAAYGERDDTFGGAVGRALRDRGLSVAAAESCTGGLIGAMLTAVPGSSDYVLLDAVTYANAAKTKVLGVAPETLRAHGAVSEETAAAMAEGALRLSGADMAVAVTGIAGPGGATDEKPVGTVWLALARKDASTVTKLRHLAGDRERVRKLSAYVALRMILRAARGHQPQDE